MGPSRSRWLWPEGVGGGGDGGEENLVEKDRCVNLNLVKESLGGNRGIERQLTVGGILNIQPVVSGVDLPNSKGKGVMGQISLLGKKGGELEIVDDRQRTRGIEGDEAQSSALFHS